MFPDYLINLAKAHYVGDYTVLPIFVDALLNEGLNQCAQHFRSGNHTNSQCLLNTYICNNGTSKIPMFCKDELLVYEQKRRL